MSDYVQGDVGVVYSATCRRGDESIIDLTGRTVFLLFRINSGPLKRRQMDIENPPTAGNVSYSFQGGDLDASGIMTLELEIEGFLGGVIIDGSNDKLDFHPSGTGNLVATLAHGTYGSGAALASIVTEALVDAFLPDWAECIFDTGTSKIRLESQIITEWLFLSGANFGNSAHPALGFIDDDSDFVTTYIAQNPISFNVILMTSKDPKQYTVRPRV